MFLLFILKQEVSQIIVLEIIGDKREICIFVCWCIKTEEYEQ